MTASSAKSKFDNGLPYIKFPLKHVYEKKLFGFLIVIYMWFSCLVLFRALNTRKSDSNIRTNLMHFTGTADSVVILRYVLNSA